MASSEAPPAPEQIGAWRQFGGYNRRYSHASTSCGCRMTYTVFFPPKACDAGEGKAPAAPVPVLIYLSGLTCTDENFIQKAGAQRTAAELGIALVGPDTSPRGLAVEGEADSWDFGVGAGFYVNATQDKWKNWRMFDYVTQELPALLSAHCPQLDMGRVSIFGHSMGGHGALTLALRSPGAYRSVSAFAPICNPTQVPWGIKAFTGYLGEDREAWKAHDAVELVRANAELAAAGKLPPLLVDTGSADSFLKEQLKPETLEAACKEAGYANVTLRVQEGYDHSYFFISTFVEDHIRFHAQALAK